jgi:hypothetical protein
MGPSRAVLTLLELIGTGSLSVSTAGQIVQGFIADFQIWACNRHAEMESDPTPTVHGFPNQPPDLPARGGSLNQIGTSRVPPPHNTETLKSSCVALRPHWGVRALPRGRI